MGVIRKRRPGRSAHRRGFGQKREFESEALLGAIAIFRGGV